ncbi:U-box domain-containing protein 5-like isoform X1 [Prosopis cineraria]|uniref:U-box domain-containing protein 5-like isoform X1 n=1 Tax=Prosopis cineraria TaxID=364024 RepID=UPI00240EBA67|nr:U-box domain-containing protein 5-like isoform X1 [Prosopis cineraria]XP_054808987.1 U-box domain-containing protein 5-like isoform X1 [Prosopis cineraria]XP_054808988.1 U-box domain-containing protein 5-like isoform X1 [Prosopis cineraria]XP_054808989.1 U-box domain-containing protein 5-like isoform X1 [Prosopis cineraria]
MGTDYGEVVETLPNIRSFKVHRKMCTELMKLVDRVSRIFPDIEAARPRCSSGIQSLCLLNSAVEKAKLLLQHCSEASKLYLAVTGDRVLSRFQKARRSLEQSLGQVQSIVPVMLAAEISQIIDDLACMTIVLDSAEEEAGRVVKELLQQGASTSDSIENSEIKALQFAAARLNITSHKAILTEKRSIKKLLDKVGPNEQAKQKILRYLWYLLKKHGNLITGEHMEMVYPYSEGPILTENCSQHSRLNNYVQPGRCFNYEQFETRNSEMGRAEPPEEYKCPISSRLMYDPVVIASGATYERMWIQKWFDEGNDICPKTKKKLSHLSLTPNTVMKDLISKWCRNNGLTLAEPQKRAKEFRSWEVSSTSIRSFGSSMNDLHLPVDLSGMSLGSLDYSQGSDSSHARNNDLNLMLKKAADNSWSHLVNVHVHDTDLKILSKFQDLEWDSQCQAIKDLTDRLKCNCQASCSVSSENFVEPLSRFLSSAYEHQDVKALRTGTQLLMEFVSNCGKDLSYLREDTFGMLASFLHLEVIGEALSIMEKLSANQHNKATIATSSVLTSILKILDSDSREFQEQAIRILYNLSFNSESCSHMASLGCIPKLMPFFKDQALLRYCICILKSLCDIEVGRVSVAGTSGCISAVAEIIDTGGVEEQEHALSVLLSLCSQREDYCQLVMYEGVIPSLVTISVNGSDNGKASALELLRLLGDVRYEEESVKPRFDTQDTNDHPQEKKSSKTSEFLKKLSPFLKSKR